MSVTADQERLDELRTRLANLSPGPWRTSAGGHIWSADEHLVATCPPDVRAHTTDRSHANAEFIRTAPEDLAWLTDLITDLQKMLSDRLEEKKV